jgi:hypothetical protein
MRIVSPTLPYPVEILRSLRFNVSGLPLHRSYACYVFSVREGKLRLVKSRILSINYGCFLPTGFCSCRAPLKGVLEGALQAPSVPHVPAGCWCLGLVGFG